MILQLPYKIALATDAIGGMNIDGGYMSSI